MAAALARPLEATRRAVRGELARGSAVNLGFALANAALAFAASVFAGNALGPAGVGVLSLGFLVLEFAGMVDNLASAGFMRDYAAGADPRKLATVARLKLALGAGTALLMALAAPLLAPALAIPVELLLLLAVVPVTSVLASLATMAHEARRRPWRRSAPGTTEALAKGTLYGAFWVLYGTGAGVLLFAWGAVGASVVGAAAGALLLHRLPARGWDAARARGYLQFGLRAQTAGALEKAIFWMDILLIDVLLQSHHQQGLYRVAYSVMAFVPLFAGTVAVFLFPALSEASQLGQHARVRELLRRSFGLVLAIAVPLALLAVALAEPAMALFGPEFREAAWVLRALALTALLPALLVPFQALFPALGSPGTSLRILAAMVAINAALDLALIPRMGILGAIVATSMAYAAGLALAWRAARRMGALGRPAA